MRVLIVLALIGLAGCAGNSPGGAGDAPPQQAQGFYMHGSVGAVFGVMGR